MTENKQFEPEQFEPDCNDDNNQYDYSILNSRYEANTERNEIIEWNKDSCNAQYVGLERIAERLNFKQMQLEECHKCYEKLYKENEQCKMMIATLLEENQSIKKHIGELYKYVKIDVDNEIEVYPKALLEGIVDILKIIGDVE